MRNVYRMVAPLLALTGIVVTAVPARADGNGWYVGIDGVVLQSKAENFSAYIPFRFEFETTHLRLKVGRQVLDTSRSRGVTCTAMRGRTSIDSTP